MESLKFPTVFSVSRAADKNLCRFENMLTGNLL